jgi:hypothetical protein
VKIVATEPLPHILEVEDVVNDTINDIIMPGGILQLSGDRLKFIQTEENNGVFLINEQDEEISRKLMVSFPGKRSWDGGVELLLLFFGCS